MVSGRFREFVGLWVATTLLVAATGCLGAQLEIVGTGDGVKVLGAVGKAFSAANPGVEVLVPESIGSSGGIKAVGSDMHLLGRVARPLKDKEQSYGRTWKAFAKVPVVFFVHPDVSVDNLTTQQILDLYSGAIDRGDRVGGGKDKVRVVRREEGDSSLKSLEQSLPGWKDIAITEKSKTATSTPEAFASVEETAGAIGFGPHDVAAGSKVKLLALDGRQADDPGYPVFTTLALIYKEENFKGNVKNFVEFATASQGRATARTAGGMAP